MNATKLIHCSSALRPERRAHVASFYKSSLGPSPTLNNYATRLSQINIKFQFGTDTPKPTTDRKKKPLHEISKHQLKIKQKKLSY